MVEISMAVVLLARFCETIDSWVDYLDGYSLEELRRQPDENSWSLGQVYVHMIADTSYFVEQMNESLKSGSNSEKSMHENAKVMLRNNELPDMKIKGPATNIVIRQPESKDALKQSLLSIKEEVKKLFSASDISNSQGKTKHPGLLYFDAFEWLQFAEMHMRHHFRQKKRIDAQLFPERSAGNNAS